MNNAVERANPVWATILLYATIPFISGHFKENVD